MLHFIFIIIRYIKASLQESQSFHSSEVIFSQWNIIKSPLGNKFFSISNNMNFVTIKTLCTLSWHHRHVLFTKMFYSYFYFSLWKFVYKMLWDFFKYISHVASKFCSKSYQSNSIALKTLTIPSGHHLLASCTIFKNGSPSAKVPIAQAELSPPSPPLSPPL